MRHGTFLFILFSQFIVVSGAIAQEDAGTDSGPLESIDATADCMQACAREYELCVTSATIPLCIANVPECAGLAPRTTEIMAAFCDACGRAAVGCGGEEAPEGAVLAAGTEPSPDPPPTETSPRRRLTPEERERAAAERARGICVRQRGIWDAEAFILMPDGTGRIGICRTPEGAELARMIRDEHDARAEADEGLDRRITTEREERREADHRHDDDIAIIRSDIEAQNSRIAMMIAHFICAESRVDRWPVASLDPTTRAYLERDSGLVHDGYVECIHLRETDLGRASVRDEPPVRSSREEHVPAATHPSLFGSGWRPHLRISLLGWMGFTPIHPSLVQTRGTVGSLPAGIGADATVAMSVYGGLYLSAGVGLTYDWPEFSPFATAARLWYHGGLYYHLIREISIGLGYLGSDRFRPSMQSAHSFHGVYLDLSFHGRLRIVDGRIQGSEDMDDPALVFTIRGAGGASIRPAAGTDADGLIQFLLGFEI